MNAPLKLGLIGCGRAAERLHLPAVQRTAEVGLVAVSDPSTERAALLAGAVAGCRVFATAESLVEEGGVEALIIAAPARMHRSLIELAVRRRIPALVEKPLAPSAVGLEELVHSAASASLMIGYNRRYWEPLQRLARALREWDHSSGARARLELITDPSEWQPLTGRRDPLEDLATHQIDLLRFLFDREISTVSARLSAHSAELRIVLEGGIRAEAYAAHAGAYWESVTVQLPGRAYWVRAGSDRIAPATESVRGAIDLVERLKRRALRQDSSFQLSYTRQLRAFVEFVRRGEAPRPGLEDGVRAVLAVEAARRSAAEDGREVTV